MNLISCETCGGSVSPRAWMCPHCGEGRADGMPVNALGGHVGLFTLMARLLKLFVAAIPALVLAILVLATVVAFVAGLTGLR